MPAGRKGVDGVAGALVLVMPVTERSIFPKVKPPVSVRSAFSP
jgi:hypothetical protein